MRRKIGIITLVLCIVIICADEIMGYGNDIMYSFEGQDVKVTGTVVSEKETDEGRVFVISDITVNGIRYRKKIKAAVYYETEPLLYRKVIISGSVSIPRGRRNPGCFDYRKHLKSNGIYSCMTVNSLQITGEASGIRRIIRRMRLHTGEFLRDSLSDESFGIVMGIIFGDTSYMDDDLLESFRKGGIAHILAVSGLHMGIVYSLISRFRRKKRSLPADCITVSVLMIYCALAGFTASVMRAFIMIAVHIACTHLDLRYDFFCSCCFSMDIILLINPWQLFNTGFQMSFTACFTIAVLLPVISERTDSIFSLLIAVQTGMMPYTVYLFNYVSLLSVFSNIPVMYISGILVPAAVLAIPGSYIPVICDILAYVIEKMAEILCFMNDLLYAGGLFTFNVASPPLAVLISYYAFLAVFFSEWGRVMRKRRNFKKIACVMTVSISLAAAAGLYYDEGFSDDCFVFPDVGQGDCLHIRSIKNVLIDGGGSHGFDVGNGILRPYLLKNGVTHVDIAFITHLHMDHCKGIEELSRDFRIDTIAVFAGNRINEDDLKKQFRCKKIMYIKKGDIIRVDRNLYIEVLAPEGDELSDSDDENSNCLVLRAVYRGLSVMMTGDIDSEGEMRLINENIGADILKAAHHGSKYSSSQEFVRRVNPSAAVISVGKNNYGHPSEEVIERMESMGISVYRTDISGAVGIETSGGDKFKVDKTVE